MNRSLKSLYFTTSILNFGLSLMGIFLPVYIFQLTGNFYYLPAFYGIASLTAAIALLLSPKFLPRLGAARSVLLANVFRVVNLAFLLAAPRFLPALWAAAVFEGLIFPTFWVTFHSVFTSTGKDGTFGHNIARMGVLVSVASALAPFFGGLVVSAFGFPVLYGVGMVLILLSTIPVVWIGDHLGFRDIPPGQILRETFSPAWRPILTGFFGNRLEIMFATLVWPIFVFGALNSFTSLGAITSVFAVVGVLFMVVAGRAVDKIGSRRILPIGAVLLVPFWLLTGFTSSAVWFALLNGYRGAIAPFYGISVESFFYRIAKRDSFLSIIKREFGIHLSIILSVVLTAVLWYFFPENWPVLFIPAALGMLLSITLIRAK